MRAVVLCSGAYTTVDTAFSCRPSTRTSSERTSTLSMPVRVMPAKEFVGYALAHARLEPADVRVRAARAPAAGEDGRAVVELGAGRVRRDVVHACRLHRQPSDITRRDARTASQAPTSSRFGSVGEKRTNEGVSSGGPLSSTWSARRQRLELRAHCTRDLPDMVQERRTRFWRPSCSLSFPSCPHSCSLSMVLGFDATSSACLSAHLESTTSN
jgi:hypothetical protein